MPSVPEVDSYAKWSVEFWFDNEVPKVNFVKINWLSESLFHLPNKKCFVQNQQKKNPSQASTNLSNCLYSVCTVSLRVTFGDKLRCALSYIL